MTDEIQKLSAELDSAFFKALAEPTRLSLLLYLMQNGQQDIDSIAKAFPQDRSVISRHLQLLFDTGIVTRTQQGRRSLYQLNGSHLIGRLEGLVAQMKEAMAACCPPGPLVSIKKK